MSYLERHKIEVTTQDDTTRRFIPGRLIRRYSVMPYVNSWNITGWCVQVYAPLCEVWVRDSRFFFTRRGAQRNKKYLDAVVSSVPPFPRNL